MIGRRSRTWSNHFSAAGVLVFVASCSSNSFTPEVGEEVEPGAIAGELAMYIADYEDGTSETRYALRNADGEETRLVFAKEPNLAPGARIHVWGGPAVNGIQVEQYREIRTGKQIQSETLPKIGVPPDPPRIVCPALVTISGGTGTITLDAISNQFHTGPKSVNAFYIENSYGKNSVAGKTYGPFNYDMTTCDTSGLSKALRPMITDTTCQQYSWVMMPKVSACAWGGLASVGSPTAPAKDTWYNNSIGCVVTVQEPGHNYGMNHSSSMTCSNAPFFSDDLTTCTHNEYGDRFDPMGGGCRHMNVYQKWYQKWFDGCNAIKVSSSGTFNLLPMEQACDGVQAIELMFPGAKTRVFNRPAGGGGSAGMDTLTSYYLEYRTSVGLFDTGMTPQVLVHVGPDATVATTRGGPHMWLVDASAGATAGALASNPGMVAGGKFTDPAGGLTVTVVSIDAEKAVIQVDYAAGTGSPTCIDGTTLTPPGITTCAGTISDAGVPPIPEGGTTTPDTGRPTTDAGRDTGAAGQAGTGGSAGAAGASGAAGKGGSGGQAGTGGSGASGGGGSTTGTGGAAGATTGTGGATTGTGGSTTGTGGSTTGTGGSGGDTTGGDTTPPKPPPETGCGCRVVATPVASHEGNLAGLLAIGLGTVLASRRRRRR